MKLSSTTMDFTNLEKLSIEDKVMRPVTSMIMLQDRVGGDVISTGRLLPIDPTPLLGDYTRRIKTQFSGKWVWSEQQTGKSGIYRLLQDYYELQRAVEYWKHKDLNLVLDRYFGYKKTFDFASLEECVAFRKYLGSRRPARLCT